MATFAYSGRTRAGADVTGERVADIDGCGSRGAAARADPRHAHQAGEGEGRRPPGRSHGARRRRAKNLAVFTRQFSVMIDAGLPLVQCLEILGTQEEDKNFARRDSRDARRRRKRRVARRRDEEAPEGVRPAVHQHDRGGRGGRHPRHDSQAAGDLHREGRQAEEPGAVRDDLPVAVIVIAAVVVGVILWKVIPTFASLFAGLGAELPLPTRIVIAAEQRPGALHAVRDRSASSRSASRSGRTTARRAAAGSSTRSCSSCRSSALLMRKIAVARFCRTLSTLLASGVSILEALDITARTAGNAIVEEAHHHDAQEHRARRNDRRAAEGDGVFPPMVVQMIGVGEATGALDTMLGKIADFYEEEVDVAVAGLLTLLEPLMIAFLGGVVGGIVIAMYMPIFEPDQQADRAERVRTLADSRMICDPASRRSSPSVSSSARSCSARRS